MAFMDKLSEVASMAVSAAGESVEFGKAKAKILSEENKVKELKEALGQYVYDTVKSGDEINPDRAKDIIAEIDRHLDVIANLEASADESASEIKGTFGK